MLLIGCTYLNDACHDQSLHETHIVSHMVFQSVRLMPSCPSSSVVVRRRPSSSVVVRRRPSSSVVVRRRPSSSVVVRRRPSSSVVVRRRPSSSTFHLRSLFLRNCLITFFLLWHRALLRRYQCTVHMCIWLNHPKGQF